MNLSTIGVFFFQSLAMLAGLFVLGYPLARLIALIGGQRSQVVSVPVLGLYPLLVTSWLWSKHESGGLHSVIPTLVIVFAIVSLLCARDLHPDRVVASARRWVEQKRWKLWLNPVVAFGFLGAGYVVCYRAYFGLTYQTPASFGNLDLGIFAAGAEHLRRMSFADSGNIVGFNMGGHLPTDTVGTFIIDLFSGVILDRPVWQTTSSTLFTGLVLMALQLATVLRRGLGVRSTAAIAAASVAVISPFTLYIFGNGFMSQIYGTAMLFAGISVILSMRLTKRAVVAAAIALGFVFASLLFVYPFVVPIVVGLAVPIRVLAQRHIRNAARALVFTAIASVGGVLTSMAFVTDRLSSAIAVARSQGEATAGWAYPLFSPHEVLGFSSWYHAQSPTNPQQWFLTPHRWVGAIPIVVLLGLAILMLWRRYTGRLLIATVAVLSASYGAMYLRSGESYQQWKYVSLIAPMLVACFALLCMGALERIARKAGVREWLTLRRMSAVLVLPIFFGAYVFNDYRLSDSFFKQTPTSLYIKPELAALQNNPTILEQKQIGIRLGNWNEMWATAMFPQLRTYQLQFHYTPPVRARNIEVLESTDSASSPSLVASEQKLNGDYELIMQKPGPATVRVLNHTQEALPNAAINWRVRVTNTSNSTLVSPADDPSRGFSLQVTVVRDVADNILPGGLDDDLVVRAKDNFAIEPLPAGKTIAPGGSYVFEGSAINPLTSTFALQFDPQRADIGPYRLWTEDTLASVVVR